MRRAVVLAVVALLIVPLAAAAQEKWVRGEVTAVGGNSLTIKTAEGSMTFMFDESTEVIAPGGATATREARKLGKAGAPLDKILKVGEGVEVHYRDMAGKMHATEIRGGVTGTGSSEERKGSSMRGTVSAVSMASITVKGASGDTTFTVDAKTRVEGTGMGTRARELAGKGEAQTITQFVGQGDEVTVNFTENHADHIRVLRKAPK
jgi:hypothetical protein